MTQLKKKLNIESDEDLDYVSLSDYSSSLDKDTSGDEIAVIYAAGNIMNGDSESGITPIPFKKIFQDFYKSDVLFSYLTEILHEPPFTADPNDTCIGW